MDPRRPAGRVRAQPTTTPRRNGRDTAPAAEAERPSSARSWPTSAGRSRGVVVDSPPGAGKSTLVVRAAGAPRRRRRAADDRRADQRAGRRPHRPARRRSTRAADRPAVGRRLLRPAARVAPLERHRSAAQVADLGDPAVVIGHGRQVGLDHGRRPGRGRSSTRRTRCARTRCCAIAGRCSSGRCSWATRVSSTRSPSWTATAGPGCRWDPMQSAVAVLLRHNPDLPVHRLPVSWRLPASAAPVVSEAFYPFTGFRAGTGPGRPGAGVHRDRHRRDRLRRGRWRRRPRTGWALHELPARHTVRTDAEAVRPRAALAVRLLRRGAVAHSEQRQPARRSPPTGSPSAPRTATRSPRSAARRRVPEASRWTPPTASRAGSTT